MGTQLQHQQPLDSLKRICTSCLKELALDNFRSHKFGKFGKQACCRKCETIKEKNRLKNKEANEKRRLSRNAWYSKNRGKVAAYKAISYKENRARHLVWEARRRAKRKNITFCLDQNCVDDLQRRINNGFCEITGTPFDMSGDGKWNSPSLDRIDSSRGYEPDNVRVVCISMNAAMGTWGENPVWEMFQYWSQTQSLPRKRRRS